MQRQRRHLGHVDLEDLVLVERVIVERVGSEARAFEIGVAKRRNVSDDHAVGRDVVEVGLERRRIHRDQHVGLVAGGEDLVAGKVDLKAANAGQGSRRSADLGREIGQGRDIVARQRRFGGELHAGELHPVARVAGKANDDVVDLLAPLVCRTAAGKAVRFRGLSGCLRW